MIPKIFSSRSICNTNLVNFVRVLAMFPDHKMNHEKLFPEIVINAYNNIKYCYKKCVNELLERFIMRTELHTYF